MRRHRCGSHESRRHDYIMKDNLARLSPAIERELREAKIRNERKQAISALRESEQKYHTLFDQSPVRGIYCK